MLKKSFNIYEKNLNNYWTFRSPGYRTVEKAKIMRKLRLTLSICSKQRSTLKLRLFDYHTLMHVYSFAKIHAYTKLPVDATDIFPACQFNFIGVVGATLCPPTQKSTQANFVDRFGDIMDLTSFRLTLGSIRVQRFFWLLELVLL